MPGYSLVPVDYQPDFDGYSLVPVDYDPFAADGVTQQAQIQQAQAQPQGPPQQQPATGAGQPDDGAPAAGGVLSPLLKTVGLTALFIKNSRLAPHQQALRLLLPTVISRSLLLTAPNTRIPVGFTDTR
jgi:hypothetical protein